MKLQQWLRLKKAQLYTRWSQSDLGSLGTGTIIVPPFLSFNPGCIHLGQNVGIFENCWLDGIREYGGVAFQPRIEIGDGTSIGQQTHIIACGTLGIGRNVVMAHGVYITDNFHGYEDVNRPIMPQPLNVPGPVVIEDEVWLGEHVCVFPNVTVGKHSVIGSNAVVTKSIPPYSVAVGVPAKVIKRYNETTGSWERVAS